MDVSFIIVTYNTARMTLDCIQSIREHTRGVSFEIIVVDNASSDNSRELLGNPGPAFEHYRYIYNPENSGFSRANNLGAAIASGCFLFFMNSDMVLLNDVAAMLKYHMEAHGDTGITGPRFLNPDHSLQVSCRNFPGILFGCLKFFPFINRFFPGQTAAYYQEDRDYSHIQSVDTVSAGALMIRRQLFDEIGRFDTFSFMYAEDADICRQVRDRGLKVIFFPDARLVHYGGASTRLNSSRAVWSYYLAFYHLYKKYYFGPLGVVIKPVFMLRALAALAANHFKTDKRITWRDKQSSKTQ